MELEEAIYSRRTVRNFLPDPVPKEVLEKVINAGVASPSPLNSQPWNFIVITGQARDELVKIIRKFPDYLADILALYPKQAQYVSEERIKEFTKNLGGAPVVILVTIPKRASRLACKNDVIAAASAIQNMQLTAWSLGLGAVCMTSALWIESEILAYLDLKDEELVTVLPIGYRAFDPDPTPRNYGVAAWIGF